MSVPIEYLSPTGKLIVGTLEHLKGKAWLSGIDPDTGEPDYDGETEVWWYERVTVHREGKMIFLDEDGGEWTFDQLVPAEEEEEQDQ